jgi:hypothetical protein
LQPKLITPMRPMVPMHLHNSGISDPRVLAKVQVGSTGRVHDLVILAASHVDLADRAESLLRTALFDPGNVSENEMLRFDVNIHFSYPSDLAPGSLSVMDDVELTFNRIPIERPGVQFVSAAKLDSTPTVVDNGKVYHAEADDGSAIHGSASVQFYVDFRGRVRLPRVLSSTDPELAVAAMATVSDMQFTAPTVGNLPATTLLTMPFVTKE